MGGEFLHFDYLTSKTVREVCSLLSRVKGGMMAAAETLRKQGGKQNV